MASFKNYQLPIILHPYPPFPSLVKDLPSVHPIGVEGGIIGQIKTEKSRKTVREKFKEFKSKMLRELSVRRRNNQ